MTTPRFAAFIPLLLREETSYNANGSVRTDRDPNDPGGVTRYGIDQRSHPHVDVATLTQEQAEVIYFADWQRTQVELLPARIGELLFDIAQNGGPGAIWLQEALKVPADGFIGPVTRQTAAALDANGVRAVVISICNQRVARFTRLASGSVRLATFLHGWLNRDADVRAFCLEPIDPNERFA